MKLYLVISGVAPDYISEYGYYIHKENAERILQELTPKFSNIIPIGKPRREPDSILDYDPRIIELETRDN